MNNPTQPFNMMLPNGNWVFYATQSAIHHISQKTGLCAQMSILFTWKVIRGAQTTIRDTQIAVRDGKSFIRVFQSIFNSFTTYYQHSFIHQLNIN